MDDTVTIAMKEYEALVEAKKMLMCLKLAGVDNWCGYDDAIDMCYGDDDDED